MTSRILAFCALLAISNAGFIGAPATYAPGLSIQNAPALAYSPAIQAGVPAVHTIASAPALAYSSAPAVSHSYFRQSSLRYAAGSPTLAVSSPAVAHVAAPALSYAAPVAGYAASAYGGVQVPAIGQTTQSVVRSLGGNAAVSHYSKAVDSAYSSVRKYDTRITNDGLALAHAPVVSSYAAPAISTYAAPAYSTYAAAPAYSTYAAAPAYSTYASAPAVSTYTTHTSPVVTAHTAPVLSTYAAHSPVVTSYATPAVTGYATPAVTGYAAHASVAPVVAHTTFSGLGTQYAW